jgi:hypothetical protein
VAAGHPHITALHAHVAPTRPRPEWADEKLPPDVGLMLDVATHLRRLGGWELAPRDHASSAELIPALVRRRHTRWLLLADNGMTWLLVGWSRSDKSGTAYIFDIDTHEVSEQGSLESYVELILLDDPVTLERSPEIVAAVEAALAEKKAPPAKKNDLGLVLASHTDWAAPELEPPAALAKPLASKGHVRWLWHRTRGVLVSVTKTSLRAIVNGKPKSMGFPWKHYVQVAMSADATAVWAIGQYTNELQRLDLSTGKWTALTTGPNEGLAGIGVLPDETLVLGEQIKGKGRVRVVAVKGDKLRDVALLAHADQPKFPNPQCAPELPVVVIAGLVNEASLIVRLDRGAPVIAGPTPHWIEGIRRSPDGWLLGSYLGVSWFRP